MDNQSEKLRLPTVTLIRRSRQSSEIIAYPFYVWGVRGMAIKVSEPPETPEVPEPPPSDEREHEMIDNLITSLMGIFIILAAVIGLLGLAGCDTVSEPQVQHPTDECYSSAWHADDVPSAGADPMWELFCEGKVYNAASN